MLKVNLPTITRVQRPYKLVPEAKFVFESTFPEVLNKCEGSKVKKLALKSTKPLTNLILSLPIFSNSTLLIDQNNKVIGQMLLSFKPKKTMDISYIQLDDNHRRIPHVLIDSAQTFLNEILKKGKNNSIEKLSCLPMSPTQEKLYAKFGFREVEDNKFEVSFEEFKNKAVKFMNAYKRR